MTAEKKPGIVFTPIGMVHSPLKKPSGAPIQAAAGKGLKARVEVFPRYARGLNGLCGFSHIILIYNFHLSAGYSLDVIPYMDTSARGVFATRAPSRPNSIGFSVVKLKKIRKNILHVEDIDILDKTPLLDIKPYVPEFDSFKKAKTGWLTKNVHKLRAARDDGRFAAGKRKKNG